MKKENPKVIDTEKPEYINTFEVNSMDLLSLLLRNGGITLSEYAELSSEITPNIMKELKRKLEEKYKHFRSLEYPHKSNKDTPSPKAEYAMRFMDAFKDVKNLVPENFSERVKALINSGAIKDIKEPLEGIKTKTSTTTSISERSKKSIPSPMSNYDAINILANHQNWRRGNIQHMPHSASDLTRAIDIVLMLASLKNTGEEK